MKQFMVMLGFGASLVLAPQPAGADSGRAIAFATIAIAQAEAGDLVGAREAAALAVDAAANPLDGPNFVPVDALAFGAAAAAQVRAGDVAGARQTATQRRYYPFDEEREFAIEPTIPLIAMALAQTDAGDPQGARQTLALARETEWYSGLVQAAALYAQARSGDVVGALAAAGGLSDPESRDPALALVAAAQAEAGDSTGAFATVAAIQNEGERVSALFLTALAQANAGSTASALETAKGMPTDAAERWTIIAFAFARLVSGDGMAAAELFLTEPEYPRAAALGAAAWAQATAGDTVGAEQTAELILQAAKQIEDDSARDGALAWAARAQARAGDTTAALETAESIEDLERRAIAFMFAARASALAGDAAGARQFADRLLQEARSETDKQHRMSGLRATAAALAAAGDTAGALSLWRSIPDDEYAAILIPAYVVALIRAEAGDFAGAIEAANDVGLDERRNPPRPSSRREHRVWRRGRRARSRPCHVARCRVRRASP